MKDLKDSIGVVAAALSLIAAITFGAQRIAYERFYDEFGLAPEDLGIDLSRVIQQTAGGLAALIVFLLAGMALFAGVIWLWMRRKGASDVQFTGSDARAALLIAIAFAGVLLIEQLVLNASRADDAARCAARPDGKPVRGFRTHLPGGVLVTRLNIRADLASLRSTDPKDPLAGVWQGRQLVYLGTANGTVFVYDPSPSERRAIRVPAASVVVSTDTKTPRYTSQDGCEA